MEDFFNEENIEYVNSGNVNAKKIDPFDPFENPTENHDYNEDYSQIVPQIEIEGCEIPNKPSKTEKKRIRHFYNIAGGGLVIHLVLTSVVANALSYIVLLIILFQKNISFSEYFSGQANDVVRDIQNSSINSAITLLTYLISNLLIFFVGIKISKISFKSLFKTTSLKISNVFQYITIGVFIQYGAGWLVSILGTFMQGADIVGNSDSLMTYTSLKSILLSVFYICIVAPITEELVCRGFVMKTFSKVSQRFGIVMSAFFFGLSHGNLSQFILAFIMGLFLGYIDIKHNSLIPSMIVHFSVNIVASVMMIITNYKSIESVEYIIVSYLLMAIVIIGLVMLIIFCKKNVFPKDTIKQKFRCKNIALTSVGTIIAAGIYIIMLFNTTFG